MAGGVQSWAEVDALARECHARERVLEQADSTARRKIDQIRADLEKSSRALRSEVAEMRAAITGWVLAHRDEFPDGSKTKVMTWATVRLRQNPPGLALARKRDDWPSVTSRVIEADLTSRLRTFCAVLQGTVPGPSASKLSVRWPRLLALWEEHKSRFTDLLRHRIELDKRAIVKAAIAEELNRTDLSELGVRLEAEETVSWEPTAVIDVSGPSDQEGAPVAVSQTLDQEAAA